MKISMVGLGKLGSPMAAVLASRGFEVTGIDFNQSVVDMINDGVAPVPEPQLQELLDAHGQRLRATTDWHAGIIDTDMTGIIVPTPSDADGAFRNDYVLDAIENIGNVLRHKPGYHLVAVHSTTMPGSVGGPIRERLEACSSKRVGVDLGLCYNPEFIALGDVIKGLLQPDFILIGESDKRAGDLLAQLYGDVVGAGVPVRRMSFVNAELTKISVNTYVTMKISFANMLSEICENLPGADVDVVTDAIGQDTRIGNKYLRGGTGYGGPCFPRDTIAFMTAGRRVGAEAELAAATHAVNDRQVTRLMQLTDAQLASGDTVAVMGLSYKPGTNVIEQSQGVMVAAALAKAGYRVIVHDPAAMDAAHAVLGTSVEFASSAQDAVATADAVIAMVPWPEYQAFFADWQGNANTRLVIDCWRLAGGFNAKASATVIKLGLNQPVHERAIEAVAN